MSVPALAPVLLQQLRNFFFPGGEQAAFAIRAVRTRQEGAIRMSPEARWIPFTAKEFIDATGSSFRWEARLDPGKIGAPTVIDAYEKGHGALVVRVAGVLQVKKITGLDVDQGEIQRYLASVIFCPPMLLNHLTLEWTTIEPLTIRVRDQRDATGAAVDFDLSEDGCPRVCRAQRPRLVGKHAVLTPWSGTGSEFREYQGLRIATHLEVAWNLPEGRFTYFRGDITEFTALR
jgi:hypothetical protein